MQYQSTVLSYLIKSLGWDFFLLVYQFAYLFIDILFKFRKSIRYANHRNNSPSMYHTEKYKLPLPSFQSYFLSNLLFTSSMAFRKVGLLFLFSFLVSLFLETHSSSMMHNQKVILSGCQALRIGRKCFILQTWTIGHCIVVKSGW